MVFAAQKCYDINSYGVKNNAMNKKMYLKFGYEIIGELKDFIIKGHSEILLRKQICPISDF